jgi:hypothetical protein
MEFKSDIRTTTMGGFTCYSVSSLFYEPRNRFPAWRNRFDRGSLPLMWAVTVQFAPLAVQPLLLVSCLTGSHCPNSPVCCPASFARFPTSQPSLTCSLHYFYCSTYMILSLRLLYTHLHKDGRKYQHNLLYLQSINSIKNH